MIVCVPCVVAAPELLPLLPDLFLIALVAVVAVPAGAMFLGWKGIERLAVSSWKRLEAQDREQMEWTKPSVEIGVSEFLAAANQFKRLTKD
jgi:hypothetical protein